VLTAAAVCVLAALLASRDQLVHRAHLEKMVNLEPLETMVSPEILDIQVHQDPLENLAALVNQARAAHLALMEPKDRRESLEDLVQVDHWDQRDSMARQVTMEIAGTTVQTDHLDRLATLAHLANKAVLDNPDPQADLEKMLRTAHALVVHQSQIDSHTYVDERRTHNVDPNKVFSQLRSFMTCLTHSMY